jgi:hypothetical protein
MRTPSTPDLSLRFPIDQITGLAAAYAYAEDTEVRTIGTEARNRGWYTRQELVIVALWKTKRSRSRVRLNREDAVKDATELALRTADERLRIGVLTHLQGVLMPTASVLLHLGHRDPYPILDFRALWSLGVDQQPSYYSFELWERYVQRCRELAKEAGVDMRTLDRALWQYSDTNQPPRSGQSLR